MEDIYLGLSARVTTHGFVAVVPDGTPDADGRRFWNATPACCNFWNVDVDDVAYIRGLIDEAKSMLAIDADRVYLVGHSNGGFMSFRMACDAADAITGIATLAGSTFADPERCKPSRPVSVLAIHGTKDTDVKYEGGVFGGSPYPGAEDTAEWWKTFDACVTGPIEGAPLDLEPYVAGAETTPRSWSDCTEGTTVALWTMHDAGHIPAVEAAFTDALVEAVLAMKRAQ
jgi:polyhydroxybutyrate depolymerase